MESLNMPENKEEKSKWNLSDALIYEIAHHLSRASQLYQLMKFSDAFMNLKTITLRLSPYLKDNERKDLRRAEVDMFESIFLSKPVAFSPPSETNRKHQVLSIIRFDNYNDILMNIIKKNGLYFVVKEDKNALKT